MIEVITSFNKDYYDIIGKECVDSWIKYWPKELTLTCYVEEFNLPANERIKQIPFDQLPNSYFEFQRSNENDRVKTFAKKAYSVIHAMQNSKADRILWIDADVITLKTVDINFIKSLCPNDTLTAFMGVRHHKDRHDEKSPLVFSAETGFFILNARHMYFQEFSNRYFEYYDQHLSSNLRRFYDGDVFGAVIEEFRNKTKINDMCEAIKKSPKSPLKHLELGQYIKHFKAKHSKDYFSKNKIID